MNKKTTTKQQLKPLIDFRQAAYECFSRSGDALFELLDALLQSPYLVSFPELSCLSSFRRKWPSLYKCLQNGRIDQDQQLKLCLKFRPETERPLLVGDLTAWPRLYADTLEDRSIQHQPTPIALQAPITVGHGFSTLGIVPEESGSWFLPLLHERVSSDSTPRQKAVEQLKAVVALLTQRPMALYDSGYGSGAFFRDTVEVASDLLVRMRPNRKLYRRAEPYSGVGRPRLHGAVFRLKDPLTWGNPDDQLECTDEKLGQLRVQRWRGLHFEDAAGSPIDLLRIERLDGRGTRRDPKVVWLAWRTQQDEPLEECWRSYLRRYTIEHWYRFIKRNLHWSLPALSTAAQSELWSNLIVLGCWQLYLAKETVKDKPKPWQKPLAEMTPGRVQQGFWTLLGRIGTPARAPKPRGKSPGWEKGRPRAKRKRHELIKKSLGKQSKTASKRC